MLPGRQWSCGFQRLQIATQNELGLVAGDVGNGDVQFTGLGLGDTVSVDGVVVGTITSVGTEFEISLGAGATPEAVAFFQRRLERTASGGANWLETCYLGLLP